MLLGLQAVSSLERCPFFRVFFLERFHCSSKALSKTKARMIQFHLTLHLICSEFSLPSYVCSSHDTNLTFHSPYTDANTGVLTIFRGDNINGMGRGALVLATAVPQSTKRSILHNVQLPTMWPRSLRRTAHCHSEFSRCQNQTCNIPCVSDLH